MRRSRRLSVVAGGLLALAGATGLVGTAAAAGGNGTFALAIASATRLDTAAETVTLPLLEGTHSGQKIYYVVTDDSDKQDAARRGVNWAPKLANALGGTGAAVQKASLVGGVVEFPGIVDFSPVRKVVPGPPGNEFAGGSFTPGSKGGPGYSPLITTGGGIVIEATQVADDSGQHDSVVTLDKAGHTVTMKTFFGFWNGHRTVYLHQDASSPEVAAAEGSTYAPNLDAAPGLGSNDVKTSARSAIIPVVNGVVGATDPARQGLNSALRGEGDPLNVNQDIPGQGNGRYSPVWDVHPVVWTQAAIDSGQRRQLTSGSDVANAFTHGLVTGGGGPANPSLGGLTAGGFISNCPIVATG
jgi:hypothetical protein